MQDRRAMPSAMDEDFLTQHLGSLLVRQPESSRQAMEKTSSRDTIDRSLASPTRLRRSAGGVTLPSTSEAKAGESFNISALPYEVGALSPIDGVIGSFFMSNATSRSFSGAGRTDESPSDRRDSFDWTQTGGSGRAKPASPGATSTSMSMSFGRRPSAGTRKHSSSGGSISSRLDTPSSYSKSGTDDRRASESTQSSGPKTCDTGLTTPQPYSEDQSPNEFDVWPELKEVEEATEAEERDPKVTTVTSPLVEESGDQTTWTRFKRGEVIEPPEADSQSPSAAQWAKRKDSDESYASSSSRYVSMTLQRNPRSGSMSKNSSSAVPESTASAALQNAVTLIPKGDDGRTFRFVSRGESTRITARSGALPTSVLAPSFDSDDGDDGPHTPEQIQGAIQSKVDSVWLDSPSSQTTIQHSRFG